MLKLNENVIICKFLLFPFLLFCCFFFRAPSVHIHHCRIICTSMTLNLYFYLSFVQCKEREREASFVYNKFNLRMYERWRNKYIVSVHILWFHSIKVQIRIRNGMLGISCVCYRLSSLFRCFALFLFHSYLPSTFHVLSHKINSLTIISNSHHILGHI